MTPPGVPALDTLAGPWLDRSELAHLPSLRNQWGQAHVNADLTSLSWLAIPPFTAGYHAGVLRVDGAVPGAQRLRWFPWGVQRSGRAGGLRVRTDTRLGYESTEVLWQVEVTNTTTEPLTSTVEQELLAPVAHSEVDWGWLYGTPWSAGHHHDYYTTERIRAEVLAATPRPVHLVAPDTRYVRLGSPRIPGIQRDEDREEDRNEAVAPMLLESELPDHSTPDSGRVRAAAAHVLDRDEAEVRLAPVALPDGSVLTVEIRPDAPATTGVVLTHGNHPDSVQLGLTDGRPWLRIAGEHLAADGPPLAPGAWHELAVTVSRSGAGDLGLLDEVAAGHSVLDHLRAMAYRPRTRRAGFGAGVLVDFGRDPWELLECVPNYRDAVVSFNAGYVGMLRDLADLLRHLGFKEEDAEASDVDADRLAVAVLGQYADGGRWRIAHPDGDETIGHVLDFALVAADMPEDLSPAQRQEMVAFVETHLLDGDWMRALAGDDPVAPRSDRPDHGAAGAFAAWPGATAYGLCRLGRPDLAQQVLSRAHAATSGGLWGQAMEAVGDGRFRVAERGVSNRDSNAAVAVTEAVITGLFGLRVGFSTLDEPSGVHSAPAGRLRHVNASRFDIGSTPRRDGVASGRPASDHRINSDRRRRPWH